MRILKQFFKSIPLTTLLFAGFAAGSIAQDTVTIVDPMAKAPVILTTSPTVGEVHVDPGSVIEITFSSDMDEKSINGTTLQLHATYTDTIYEMHSEVLLDDQIRGRSAVKDTEKSWHHTADAVNGTISYSNKVAVFTPDRELRNGTLYTFTVTNDVKNSEMIALEKDQNWSFTTIGTFDSTYSDNQNDRFGMERSEDRSLNAMPTEKLKTFELGKAGQFVILAKENIHNESESKVTGHIGEGTVADKIKKEKDYTDSSRQRISGQFVILQSNQSDTTSPDVSKAIEDMMIAYGIASSQNGDDLTSHQHERFQNGAITSGVHRWSNSLHLKSDVTLSGSAVDVWLFKVSDDLIIDNNIVITLTNGARAENIFWFVEGEVTIGKNVQFEGVILSMNEITLEKGAILNGRLFSQTSITLDDNIITEPRSNTGLKTSSTNR